MRRWPTVVLALAVCGVLGGCGSSGSDPSSGQSITLYSGQHEQTVNGLVTAFEKQTGITVNVRNDDEDTLANLISLQGSHSPADVFYTENSPALEFLQEKGLLAPVQASTLARTPAKYNSAAGDWVAVSARVSVLIYNPSLIAKSQLPTSVTQLADPKYQGKLAFAAGETDFQPIVTSVLHAYGHAKTVSTMTAPASRLPISSAATVTTGIAALRKTWRPTTPTRPPTPSRWAAGTASSPNRR